MTANADSSDQLPLRERLWFIAVVLMIIAGLLFLLVYSPHRQKQRCEELIALTSEEFAVEGISAAAMDRYILDREVEYLENCM